MLSKPPQQGFLYMTSPSDSFQFSPTCGCRLMDGELKDLIKTAGWEFAHNMESFRALVSTKGCWTGLLWMQGIKRCIVYGEL